MGITWRSKIAPNISGSARRLGDDLGVSRRRSYGSVIVQHPRMVARPSDAARRCWLAPPPSPPRALNVFTAQGAFNVDPSTRGGDLDMAITGDLSASLLDSRNARVALGVRRITVMPIAAA